jgi:hypothetical protein
MSDMRQIPAELQNRARSPEEQQQMLMDATMSGNPYLESIAPKMYADMEAQTDAAAERQRQLEVISQLDIPEDRKQMLIAGMTFGDNPLAKQAFQGEDYNQGTSGVEAKALDLYMSGQPLTPEQKRVVEGYFAKVQRQSYIAPPRGGGGGRSGGGGGSNSTMQALEAELRRRGML